MTWSGFNLDTYNLPYIVVEVALEHSLNTSSWGIMVIQKKLMIWSFIPPHAPYSAAFNRMLVLFCCFVLQTLHINETMSFSTSGQQHWRPSVCWSQYRSNSPEIEAYFLDVVAKIEGSQLWICWESRGISPGKLRHNSWEGGCVSFFSRVMDCWSLGHFIASCPSPLQEGLLGWGGKNTGTKYSEGTRMQGICVRKKGYHFARQTRGRCPCQRIKGSSPGFAFNMCGHARHAQGNWKCAPSRLHAYLVCGRCLASSEHLHLLGAGLRYNVIWFVKIDDRSFALWSRPSSSHLLEITL